MIVGWLHLLLFIFLAGLPKWPGSVMIFLYSYFYLIGAIEFYI
jgi:hypothetical protein